MSSRPPRQHRLSAPSGTHRRAAGDNPPREAGKPPVQLLRVAGLAAVSALFQQAPDRVVRLFYEERKAPEMGVFCARMAEWRRPYRMVGGDELAKIAGTVLHGGVVAVANPPPERVLTAQEAQRLAVIRQPLFILDGIGNPHNLGAIARTLAFFGHRQLALSDHPHQAGPSDAAYRIAEGGLDWLTIYRASSLPQLLRQIRPLYRVVGTALRRRGFSLEELGQDERPTAVVLGNEETGLPAATLAACERVVTIPGAGSVQSLNVAATAAIIAHALRPSNPSSGGGTGSARAAVKAQPPGRRPRRQT